MSGVKAFVSDHPDVLTAYAQSEAANRELHDRLKEASELVSGRNFMSHLGFRGTTIVGLALLDDDTPDKYPDGWMKLKRDDYLTPNKRTKAGKQAQAWLDSFAFPDLATAMEPFGVPRNSMAIGDNVFDGHWYSPGIARYGDRVFVTWNENVNWSGSDYFEPIKLSEYYAAKESAE